MGNKRLQEKFCPPARLLLVTVALACSLLSISHRSVAQPLAPEFAPNSVTPDAPSDRPSAPNVTNRGSLAADIAANEQQLKTLIAEDGADSLPVARVRGQLGALHYLNGQPMKALLQLQMAIPRLEHGLGIFNHELVEPLGYLGLSQQQLERHEAAADTLTRAQHITHRARGTLNESQIPLVYSKADSLQAQGQWWQAEQLQYTVYHLHKYNYGPAAPETLGAMNQLGTWLTRAGRIKPALSLYRTALKDLQDDQGKDTPAMAPLLEGMARTFLFGTGPRGRSLNLLLRVKTLTQQHPDDFGPADQLMASLQLADALMLFSLERDAMPHYLDAWQAIENTPGLSQWERSQFAQRQLVSGPFEELTAQQAKSRMHFRFSFDLRKDGRPHNVKLISTNARPTLVLPTLATFRAVRFRPQFESGEATVRVEQEIWLSYRRLSNT